MSSSVNLILMAFGFALPGAVSMELMWHRYVPAGTASDFAALNDNDVRGEVVMASDSLLEDEVRY